MENNRNNKKLGHTGTEEGKNTSGFANRGIKAPTDPPGDKQQRLYTLLYMCTRTRQLRGSGLHSAQIQLTPGVPCCCWAVTGTPVTMAIWATSSAGSTV